MVRLGVLTLIESGHEHFFLMIVDAAELSGRHFQVLRLQLATVKIRSEVAAIFLIIKRPTCHTCLRFILCLLTLQKVKN